MDTVDELERGREAYRRRGWLDAFKSLTLADEAEPLAAPDLELLGTAAYLIGRTHDGVRALERAHHRQLDAGEPVRAAWCAIWVGFGLVQMTELAQAGGWFGRAQRLLDREQRDCVEQAYLLVPAILQQIGAPDSSSPPTRRRAWPPRRVNASFGVVASGPARWRSGATRSRRW